jgi:SAM-dependent methyltransferase
MLQLDRLFCSQNRGSELNVKSFVELDSMSKTRDAYDRWSATYDSDPNPQTALEEHSVMKLVSPKPGDRILDAACGTGRYCRLFRDAGAEVIGADFSEGMLRVARTALPSVRFHIADLTSQLPFSDGEFGKINCAQALKHFPDIRPVIKEFARLIASGGTVTFSVTHPDMNWDGYQLSYSPPFILSEESEIHHHRFCDYFEAIEMAGLKLVGFRQLPIDERIKEYLTIESFQKVKGRYQIALFHSIK